MPKSLSKLARPDIVEQLKGLVAGDQIVVDEQQLKEASVDRFKKYQSVHGIFDGPIPAAIVNARSTEDVQKVLAFANDNKINVVARTGRTGTEGGLETAIEDTIVLDGSGINEIFEIDIENMQATVGCGVQLQVLEDELRKQGLTTGHSPQSKPLAQYGGLVSTRSIGQFSTLYGAIEDMVVGLEAVFADGSVTRIKSVPRRSAGPDIRHIVIGNEGALCYITEVTVKIFKYMPGNNEFHGFLVDDMTTGISVIREVVTNGFNPSVVRVYSPEDARQHFADFYDNKVVVVFVAEGPKSIVKATSEEITRVIDQYPHVKVDPKRIENWFDNLNWGQDKIEAEKQVMLAQAELGYTTEVSVDWSRTVELYDNVMGRIRNEYPHAADLTMLGAHSSHSYQTGTNLYFVYGYKINCEPREEIHKYHIPLNAIIVEEALKAHGSIVHHHGIGKYRAPWAAEEHGSAYAILTKLKETFDPNGIMNKGTIFPIEG
ncbi:FAD-binding oxidoreductase [Streptomyces nodosus]|uniref:FAD-binding oxidoreductase n=1 Tax=Streptomyces nodosus TaxID=40318 RepID=A0A0B5D6S7_9ACTN|nr:FAD-binding oxidoreductase [Streptomyces nodosus]AJE38764.1 FAD-linked oxidoreductase [Streptomyces nodosus]MBB4789501.1 alkyldihydroxyacetonephosphate synthase [Streptomyces nodosus]QEV37343.1 FAD-binding oxidoreductase [Streptomyces nodosus]